MSDFDWDEFTGDRFSFENVGDLAHGRVFRIEKRTGQHGTFPVLTLTVDKAGNQKELWAGATDLKRQLADLAPQEGDVVRAEFVGEKHTGQPQPMKLFKVDVTRGTASPPVAAPEPPPAYEDGQEPF